MVVYRGTGSHYMEYRIFLLHSIASLLVIAYTVEWSYIEVPVESRYIEYFTFLLNPSTSRLVSACIVGWSYIEEEVE